MRYFVEASYGRRIDLVVTYTDEPERGDSALAVSLYHYQHDDKIEALYEHFTVSDPAWFGTVQEVPFWALSKDIQDMINHVTTAVCA